MNDDDYAVALGDRAIAPGHFLRAPRGPRPGRQGARQRRLVEELEWRQSALFRPASRYRRPPSGASCSASGWPFSALDSAGTFDCQMSTRADLTLTPTAGRSVTELLGAGVAAAALAPLELVIDPDALRVLVRDPDPVGYELWFRDGRGRSAGPGWVELCFAEDGSLCRTAVRASEVMAVARDAGREDEVAAMTEGLAGLLEQGGGRGLRSAARLREEVDAGHNLERVSLRAVRARMLELLVEGETLTAMCERGGFRYDGGKPDSTWLCRRAGLIPERCSRTGKVRTRRTAGYEVFCQLVAAVGGRPHEFGV